MDAKIVLLVIVFVCAAACNDDGSGNATCEQTVTALCENACRCGEQGGGCMYYFDNGNESFSSEGDDEEGCVIADTLFYCNGELDMDFGACTADLESAACGELDGVAGLQLPGSCAALGGITDNSDERGESTPYDAEACASLIERVCVVNEGCVDNGYSLFTETGPSASGPFIDASCAALFGDRCRPDLGDRFGACLSVEESIVCAEDSTGSSGVRLPDACGWIIGGMK